jgi:hypothetical protein
MAVWNKLVKIANTLDKKGYYQLADKIDLLLKFSDDKCYYCRTKDCKHMSKEKDQSKGYRQVGDTYVNSRGECYYCGTSDCKHLEQQQQGHVEPSLPEETLEPERDDEYIFSGHGKEPPADFQPSMDYISDNAILYFQAILSILNRGRHAFSSVDVESGDYFYIIQNKLSVVDDAKGHLDHMVSLIDKNLQGYKSGYSSLSYRNKYDDQFLIAIDATLNDGNFIGVHLSANSNPRNKEAAGREVHSLQYFLELALSKLGKQINGRITTKDNDEDNIVDHNIIPDNQRNVGNQGYMGGESPIGGGYGMLGIDEGQKADDMEQDNVDTAVRSNGLTGNAVPNNFQGFSDSFFYTGYGNLEGPYGPQR